MRRILFATVLLFLFSVTDGYAQSCFNVNAGNDTTILCTQPRFTLKAKVPDLKTTEDYVSVPINYAPYAYKTPFGTESNLVYDDDHFSDSFDLPFPFCFYGNTYNKICVGSNGVITFDIRPNSNKIEGYVLERGDQIFFNGGTPNVQAMYYPPPASIFVAYYDMDPTTSPPKRKIEWRVEGDAPCRRFVVSYFQIGNYDTIKCPNSKNRCTMQAVLYEGSGLIDVFYENKPACLAYQDGLAIAGVQNWERDKAVTLPGKNGTVWTAQNEGYRYIPNGSNSLLSRVELYKNGTLIKTGTTIPLGNGELEATFSDIAQSEDSMSYVVKAFYLKCDNRAVETEGSDTMIVYKSLDALMNVKAVDPLCHDDLGQVNVLAPFVPNVYEYSIDGGANWQRSTVFSVPEGAYTVMAKEIGATTCKGSTSITLTAPRSFTGIAATIDATCNNNDGTIIITVDGGSTPYEYSLNGTSGYQFLKIFNNVPSGTYLNITSKDAHGCLTTIPATVGLNDQMFLTAGNDTTICIGSPVTLTAQTNPETNQFVWTPAASLNDAKLQNPVATPADTTHYFLTAKWGPCTRTEDIVVNVLHKPLPFAGKDTVICFKTPAFLSGTANNLSGKVNYAWSPAAGVATPNTRSSIAKPDSTQLYTLTVTDNYGCNFSVTDQVLVTMRPLIPAFAGNDTTAIFGIDHQLTGSGGKYYLWSPSTPLNNPFIQKPIAVLYNDTRFSLLVTDEIGCTNTDDIFIKVYKGPTYYIPNAFTPNGDGQNDVFRATPVGIAVTSYFNVYNRMGEMVFQTNQWLKGWDGTFKGKKADAGTYIWLIKGVDKYGKPVEMKGTVVLLR